MREYSSEAIVLRVEPVGEMDLRVSLFTKKFGKLSARARSARKVTSKLAGHLQPGNRVKTRVVEKRGYQVVDALKIDFLEHDPSELHFLHDILPEAQPEPRLWKHLSEEAFHWPAVLKILGWDPALGRCVICEGEPSYFQIKNQDFFCKKCASKLPKNALIFIYSATAE